MESGVDFTREQGSIDRVISANDLSVMELFLNFGFKPRCRDLITACSERNLEMLQLLIYYYEDFHKMDTEISKLFHAYEFDNYFPSNHHIAEPIEVISYLLSLGLNINSLDEYNRTVLDKLCSKDRNFRAVQAMVEYGGADIKFHYTCIDRCPKIARLFIKNGTLY